MTDQEFINGIWKKYDNYLKENAKNKDNFFIKYKYKKIKFRRKLRMALNCILSLISMAGIVYAGLITHEFIQKSTKTDFEKNRGYDYNQNMIYDNSMYYKKIYTYEEYLEAQKIWNNLVDMQERDFENSFVIILAGENYNTTGLYISNIYVKNEELCIELRKKDYWDINETVISVEVSRDLDREEVNIINLPNQVNTEGKYIDIELLTEEYSIEEAIEDNCVVIKDNKIISPDKNRLNEFIDNCNNKIEDLIRIYKQESKKLLIYDIEYKDNRINMVSRSFKSKNDRILYRTGNKIMSRKDDFFIYYSLLDEMGNGALICILSI